MIRIEDIIEKVERNRPDADIEMIRRAYLFSALHHRGQKRASGEPYLVHPLEVADLLADMKLDVVAMGRPFVETIRHPAIAELLGAALFGKTPSTVNELLKQADLAMYQAKRSGRDGFRIYAPALDSYARERAALESDLRRAVERASTRQLRVASRTQSRAMRMILRLSSSNAGT